MVKCSAHFCENATYKNIPGISFHRFPRDKKVCEAWLKNAKLEASTLSTHSVICSRHFEPNLIYRISKGLHLLRGAVPTLFENDICRNSSLTGHIVIKPSTSLENLSIDQQQIPYQNVQYTPQQSISLQNLSVVQKQVPNMPPQPSISSQNFQKQVPNTQTVFLSPKSKTIAKLRTQVTSKNKQIKALKERQRRLIKKVVTFSEVIKHLKTKLDHENEYILGN